jgi:CelD/BcsL family acetyltransferase involved in cellulose biosynthesis
MDNIDVAIEPLEDVAALEPQWRDLEARADASFHLSWNWIGCWLATTGLKPQVLIARCGGRVVALALLQSGQERRHGWLRANTLLLHQVGDPGMDVITVEYNGFLVDRAAGPAVAERCLARLTGTPSVDGSGTEWDELHLSGVPEAYGELAKRSGLNLIVRAHKPAAAVDLEAVRRSGRSYLDHLSANTRYQIRRALRLYGTRGAVTIAAARDVAEGLRYFEELGVLHQAYWTAKGEPGAWSYPYFLRFHRAMIERCLPAGTVEVVRIAAGDQAIGYLYNFIYRGWVYAYLSGLAYDADPKLKPGLVSHYLCAERHLAAGARIYDFMAGDHRYKSNLGTLKTEMLWLILQRPRLKLRLEDGLRRAKHAVRAGLSALRRGSAQPGRDGPAANEPPAEASRGRR